MRTNLYLDRQSETAYRTYRVYIDGIGGFQDHIYAGKVNQPHHGGRWFAGVADKHANGHTTRAQAVHCLLARVYQPALRVAP